MVLIRLLCVVLLAGLVGCAAGGRAPVEDRRAGGKSSTVQHVVQRGDTLYSIAFRYGLDYRKVAEVNSIVAPYTIYPGQTLYLWKVSSSPAYVAPAQAMPPPASLPGPTPVPSGPVQAAPGGSAVVVNAVPELAIPEQSAPAQAAPSVVATGTTAINRGGASAAPATAPVVVPVAGSVPVAAPPAPAPVPQPAPSPAAAPAVPPPPPPPNPQGKVTAWLWPASGPVTRGYQSNVHKGIDIGGERGDPVRAVADGVVVYAGTGIVGFGELLIVKHNDIYISAYGHNDRLLVGENAVVRAGQTIAEKGSSGTDTVKLHFEIRKEGKPVDPLKLLPRR
jgi:lipoprotein NlpD